MAQPTEQQIKKLEEAHKKALANLLQAIKFRYILYTKFGSNSKAWRNYADMIWKLWQNWYNRQKKYEQAGVSKENIDKNDWLTPTGQKKLEALLNKWDTGRTQGIGFVPLLVWAVIALAGFFTADQIVDELNTTAEEQQELITTTKNYCQEFNLDAEQCKQFMTQQQSAINPPDSGFSGIGKMIFLVGIGFLLITNSDKIFKTKKT